MRQQANRNYETKLFACTGQQLIGKNPSILRMCEKYDVIITGKSCANRIRAKPVKSRGPSVSYHPIYHDLMLRLLPVALWGLSLLRHLAYSTCWK